MAKYGGGSTRLHLDIFGKTYHTPKTPEKLI